VYYFGMKNLQNLSSFDLGSEIEDGDGRSRNNFD
jgi:hypothetical protein